MHLIGLEVCTRIYLLTLLFPVSSKCKRGLNLTLLLCLVSVLITSSKYFGIYRDCLDHLTTHQTKENKQMKNPSKQ